MEFKWTIGGFRRWLNLLRDTAIMSMGMESPVYTVDAPTPSGLKELRFVLKLIADGSSATNFHLALSNQSIKSSLACDYQVSYGGHSAHAYSEVILKAGEEHHGDPLNEKDVHLVEYFHSVDDAAVVVKMRLFMPKQESILKDLFDNYEGGLRFTDAILISSDGQEFPCHKFMLAARSTVFSAMFGFQSSTEASSGRVEVKDVDSDTLAALLSYLYTDIIGDQGGFTPELMAAADKYDIGPLKDLCEGVLAKRIDADNAAKSYLMANLHRAERLKARAVHFIAEHWTRVKASDGWKGLRQNPSVVEDILDQVIGIDIERRRVEEALLSNISFC